MQDIKKDCSIYIRVLDGNSKVITENKIDIDVDDGFAGFIRWLFANLFGRANKSYVDIS